MFKCFLLCKCKALGRNMSIFVKQKKCSFKFCYINIFVTLLTINSGFEKRFLLFVWQRAESTKEMNCKQQSNLCSAYLDVFGLRQSPRLPSFPLSEKRKRNAWKVQSQSRRKKVRENDGNVGETITFWNGLKHISSLLCSAEMKTALHFALVLQLKNLTIERERVKKSL